MSTGARMLDVEILGVTCTVLYDWFEEEDYCDITHVYVGGMDVSSWIEYIIGYGNVHEALDNYAKAQKALGE